MGHECNQSALLTKWERRFHTGELRAVIEKNKTISYLYSEEKRHLNYRLQLIWTTYATKTETTASMLSFQCMNLREVIFS